jgi:hypothetical protein
VLAASDLPGLHHLINLAAGESPQIPALAIASVIAAALGGLGGVLTAQATRSRGATEGFRDLTTDLQQERDTIKAELAAARIEIDRLRYLCYDHGIDWRPPDPVTTTTGAAPT